MEPDGHIKTSSLQDHSNPDDPFEKWLQVAKKYLLKRLPKGQATTTLSQTQINSFIDNYLKDLLLSLYAHRIEVPIKRATCERRFDIFESTQNKKAQISSRVKYLLSQIMGDDKPDETIQTIRDISYLLTPSYVQPRYSWGTFFNEDIPFTRSQDRLYNATYLGRIIGSKESDLNDYSRKRTIRMTCFENEML